MIKIIILLITLGVATAQYAHHGGIVKAAAIADEPIYKPDPYTFTYEIHDGFGNNHYQKEEGDLHNNKRGSYGYIDAHGIQRRVHYIADAHGFRASIQTNEPGTANIQPAAVNLHAAPVHVAPVKAKAALAVAPAHVAAPSYAYAAAPAHAYAAAPAHSYGVAPAYSYGASPVAYGAEHDFGFKEAYAGPAAYGTGYKAAFAAVPVATNYGYGAAVAAKPSGFLNQQIDYGHHGYKAAITPSVQYAGHY